MTLQVIHDIADQDGTPWPIAPRNVLRRVVELYNARGWQPIVAPEMEFYLVARNIDPNQPIEPPMGRTGRRAAARQAYSMSAVDEYGPVIDDIYDFAEAQGFEIDGILQEGGAGQIEMNLRHGDPVKPRRRDLLLQAADPRGCAAPRLLRNLHGKADPGRTGIGHAHPPFRRRRQDRAQHLLRRQGQRDGGLRPLHRRNAEAPARA